MVLRLAEASLSLVRMSFFLSRGAECGLLLAAVDSLALRSDLLLAVGRQGYGFGGKSCLVPLLLQYLVLLVAQHL